LPSSSSRFSGNVVMKLRLTNRPTIPYRKVASMLATDPARGLYPSH
jgi:hypothetical protein